MGFPDSFVEEVRRTADIVRYISEQVSLRKMGTSWKGLCPFHQEKTPSFNVRQEPPLFHCFGCGEGGDVFKFVMLRERVAFPEAIEMIARRFGIPIPETRGFERGEDRKEREEILALLEAAAQRFTRNFWTAPGTRAREYLLGRGFQKETLEKIRVGATPDSWSDLLDSLRSKFAPKLMLSAGLILERQDKSGHYDRFRNRAIFPILNESGKVVAFGARSLDGSDPKYLNSPETPVYQKSRVLYGLNWARDPIRDNGRAVLMEGYLDVARAIESGVGEAVASCGTAMTPGQARLLHRFGERVVVNFDQDEAGRKATLKSLEILTEEGLDVRVVDLPDGHDPDTFLRESGADAYRKRLDEAPASMEWLIARAAAQNDTRTPQGKAAYLKELLPSLARIDSAVERAAWLPKVAAAGGLDGAAADQELRRALSLRGGTAPVAAAPVRSLASNRLTPAEKWLLALIVQETEGVREALSELQEDDIANLKTAAILRTAKSLQDKGQSATAAALMEAVEADEDRRLLRELAIEATPVEHADALFCVLELRRATLGRRLEQAKAGVRDRQSKGEDWRELLLESNRLAKELEALKLRGLTPAPRASEPHTR
jgi:DNA primase